MQQSYCDLAAANIVPAAPRDSGRGNIRILTLVSPEWPPTTYNISFNINGLDMFDYS